LLRVTACLLFLYGSAWASGTEFLRAAGFAYSGPEKAKGVLVWVPGTYGRDQSGPPDPPDFVAREAASGMDVWCFNRDRGDDPLARGGDTLAHEIQALRDQGYRRVIVAGHSRGAWIALTVLSHPGLADGVVAFDPAAHGRQDARKAQAMADWTSLWDVAVNSGTHVVLVQLLDDPWDPDPPLRLAIARERLGANLLSIFQPAEPTGHAGVYEPAFDEHFGAKIADFLH
jgi:pimeloyl-ACP methyl ester carboxylesterase